MLSSTFSEQNRESNISPFPFFYSIGKQKVSLCMNHRPHAKQSFFFVGYFVLLLLEQIQEFKKKRKEDHVLNIYYRPICLKVKKIISSCDETETNKESVPLEAWEYFNQQEKGKKKIVYDKHG